LSVAKWLLTTTAITSQLKGSICCVLVANVPKASFHAKTQYWSNGVQDVE